MRKQFRIALLIMAYLWCWVGALAVPANPKAYVVTQPDGTTISVRLCGDEYYHYYTTEDGSPVTLCDDGFYRYTTIDAQNNLVASANVVGKVNASVLPDKKSVMQRHKELHKVNKMRKSVKLPEAQAPMRSAARNAGSNGGVVKGIIVLAEFQDQKFTFSQKAINDKMNKVGYTDEYGSIGSAHDYFVAQSYGQFQPEFDVVGPVTLSQNMAYYGAADENNVDIRPHEMVAEACQLASQQGLADMSVYDHDGDGWVDLVYVIYAGYPESSGAPSETIWPHAWHIYYGAGKTVIVDGVQLDAYACSAELNGNSGSNLDGIGTFCHEYSHTLGLPDFYDIDYSGAMGMSWWSIMASGNYGANGYIPIGYNAYEREFCGWLEFNELTGDASITMPELNTDKTAAYKITSTNPNQYITIETRCRKGWDVSLPSEGMMVIAVDYNKKAWDSNGPNDDPNRQRFKLIPADNNWSESDLYGDLYPYGGNTTLSSSSSPKMKVHNTTINGKSITGIAYNNGVTTFDFKMDDVSGDEQDSDLSYLEGTYNAFANSGFQNHPDEVWQVNITVDDTDKNKVWIQPVCMFGGLSAKYINPVYATYNAEDNTLIMPSGQVVYEDSESKFVIAQTTTGSDINLTHNFVMQIEKNDYDVEISFANDCYIGVGNILNDEWWYQALQNVSYSKTTAGGDEEGDEVPAELEGVYDAFANSAFQGNPDEKWQVNITIDKSKKGKVWIQPICMFGGLDAVDINPIYATYNAANNILILPLGQVVYEDSGYKLVIAQTTDGSEKNLTDNIIMQINNDGYGVDITFANDYILGVGDILNDEWWYQALYNVSYSKSTPEGDVATSITLDKSEVTLKATQTTTLIATVLPETATNKSVTWTSSNEAVAIVDANGTVTAVGVGEAIIMATTTDGSDLSASCVVTVLPTPGDANNDAIINVTDITTVASYILGLDTKLFVFDAADINNDDVVDVTDIVGVASIILNGGSASSVSVQRCAPNTSDVIKIEDFAAGKNQSQQVAIEMTNASDYSACQMDIRLPKGMSIAECELASAATDHMVAYRELPDGAVRVLVYSLTCRALPNSEEGIISLRTTTDNRFEGGEIVVANILFADHGQNEYRLYDSVANVNLATGVSATEMDCVVYAENQSIVIISPCDQQATITSVDGVSRTYSLNEGRNEIKDCKRGIYIIETLNRINKLIIK
ncbi:MAG: M6 family metalloprotease domain-containing protein [Muribaculaceae bacterium]|nr:M6 family metalloprotease domain-containing protein [Muribaculaceae bacterium]